MLDSHLLCFLPLLNVEWFFKESVFLTFLPTMTNKKKKENKKKTESFQSSPDHVGMKIVISKRWHHCNNCYYYLKITSFFEEDC